MSKMILYHGSNEKIEKPIFGKGKVYIQEWDFEH